MCDKVPTIGKIWYLIKCLESPTLRPPFPVLISDNRNHIIQERFGIDLRADAEQIVREATGEFVALLYRSEGTVTYVTPQNRRKFTLKELQEFVGGILNMFTPRMQAN
jgi:hypothetical protein